MLYSAHVGAESSTVPTFVKVTPLEFILGDSAGGSSVCVEPPDVSGDVLCVFGTIFSSISGKKNLIFLTENQHISSQDVGDIEIYFCDRKLGRLQLCLL